jgi:hypothetical protein
MVCLHFIIHVRTVQEASYYYLYIFTDELRSIIYAFWLESFSRRYLDIIENLDTVTLVHKYVSILPLIPCAERPFWPYTDVCQNKKNVSISITIPESEK